MGENQEYKAMQRSRLGSNSTGPDEVEDGMRSENGAESTNEVAESEQHILNFLDSMDNYLILMDSLSSSLRQGWLELASARHSMGTFRVNSALFDLKSHHASSTLQVHNDGEANKKGLPPPSFTLCKWASSDDPEKYSKEAKFEEDRSPRDNNNNSPKDCPEKYSKEAKFEVDGSLGDNNNNSPKVQEKEHLNRTGSGVSPVSHDNHARKERSRSLSMFGTLVSPKLRATQLSFETALEALVEIANVRASLLCAYEQVQKDLKADK